MTLSRNNIGNLSDITDNNNYITVNLSFAAKAGDTFVINIPASLSSQTERRCQVAACIQ